MIFRLLLFGAEDGNLSQETKGVPTTQHRKERNKINRMEGKAFRVGF
jgi:hypothetical protein